MKLSHCLPTRVRAMLEALSFQPSMLNTLIQDGCSCPNRTACVLGAACERIHRSFEPGTQGMLDIALQ